MAVVCLMIQNLISLHIPELVITQESNQVIVNDVAVDMKLVLQRFLMQSKSSNWYQVIVNGFHYKKIRRKNAIR